MTNPSLFTFAALTLSIGGCGYRPAALPEAPDLDTVSVTTDSGDVHLAFADVAEPIVRHRRGTLSADSAPTVRISDDGTALVVDDGCVAVDSAICHVDFDITLPRRRFLMELTSDSGDLDVVGARGIVKATTDSSDLRITNAALSKVAMYSDSGDVELRNSFVTKVTRSTDSGSPDVDDASDVASFERLQ